MTNSEQMIPVMVTTAHRGVFAGLVPVSQDLNASTMALYKARMAIYWATSRGVTELADVGPNDKSKISAPADIPSLRDITAVFRLTDAAWERWSK